MSWYASWWASRCRVGNPTRKLVLLALAENCNPDGYSPVGYHYLAAVGECSEKSVQRHLAGLVEMGLLTRQRRYGSGGRMLGYDMWLRLEHHDYVEAVAKHGETSTPPTDTPETNCPGGELAQGTQSLPGGDTESTPSPTYSPTEEAGSHAPARVSDATHTEEPPVDGQRIRKILQDRGFGMRQVHTAATVNLVADWRSKGVTESELRRAMEIAEGVCRGRPTWPSYYTWAVNTVVGDRHNENGPQPGVATAGQGQQQSASTAPRESVHDLYEKDYTGGATSPDDLPEWLQE